jgi:hypothetical protein
VAKENQLINAMLLRAIPHKTIPGSMRHPRSNLNIVLILWKAENQGIEHIIKDFAAKTIKLERLKALEQWNTQKFKLKMPFSY